MAKIIKKLLLLLLCAPLIFSCAEKEEKNEEKEKKDHPQDNEEEYLGLDLKGGISATLEVSVKDILINYADNNLELKDQNGNLTAYGNFLERIESADVTRRNSQEGFIDLFLDEYASSLDKLDDLSQVFSTRDLNDEMNDTRKGIAKAYMLLLGQRAVLDDFDD